MVISVSRFPTDSSDYCLGLLPKGKIYTQPNSILVIYTFSPSQVESYQQLSDLSHRDTTEVQRHSEGYDSAFNTNLTLKVMVRISINIYGNYICMPWRP